jgi:hypothetical protein
MNLKTINEIVILPDDTMEHRTTTITPIQGTQAIIDQLSREAMLTAYRVFNLPGWDSPANIRISKTDCYVTVELKRLPLRCPFRPVKDKGYIVPVLDSQLDPVFSLNWVPVDSMRLVSLFAIGRQGASVPSASQISSHPMWLFAMSKDNRYWKLPLGNIHDDGKICLGSGANTVGNSVQEAVSNTLEHFEHAEWNADLWRNASNTMRMFRFMPKNSGFDQLPCDGTWTDLCTKIAPAVASQISLL